MKVTCKTGFCVHCGKLTTYSTLVKDDFPIIPTLDSYNDYISTMVTKCDHCNFVGENITYETNPLIFNIVQSEEYIDLLEFNYDDNIPYSQPTAKSLCLNYYDAYAYICKNLGYRESYIKALFKCATLKDILIQKYTELMHTSFDDEQLYANIVDNLTKSKNDNLKCIIENTKNITNEYIKCILCESLIMLENFAKARMLLHNLKISDDLKQHFLSLINSYEVDL